MQISQEQNQLAGKSFIVKEGAGTIGSEVGFNIAVYGFVEGSVDARISVAAVSFAVDEETDSITINLPPIDLATQ